MPRTRIKICGITRPEDAELAADLGADAIGLNFYQGPRQIDKNRAAEIVRVVPCLTALIGLFGVTEDTDDSCLRICDLSIALRGINSGICGRSLTAFQLYAPSHDAMEFFVNEISSHHFVFWYTAKVASRESLTGLRDLLDQFEFFRPPGLVLDACVSGSEGGTGQTFNWHWIAEARAAGELNGLPPIILAGGLNPDNVADAIRIAKPYAVDVSSGVEVPGKPGIKDPARLRDFIQAVQGA